MLEGFLTVTGVLLAAGGAGTEWAAQRSATRMAVPEARLADLAEEFANIAAAVLRKVEIRTAALETLVRQEKPVHTGVARSMVPVRAVPAPRRPQRRELAEAPQPLATGVPVSSLVTEVAALAREGLSPREIARRMQVSSSVVNVALRLDARPLEEVQP